MLIRSQDKEILANMEGPIAIEVLSDGKGPLHSTMFLLIRSAPRIFTT